MYERRDVLKVGLSGAAALLPLPALAQGEPEITLKRLDPAAGFEGQQVVELARALAQRPFKPAKADLPEAFSNLSAEAYAGIHARPAGILWLKDAVGYAIEPLHRGYAFGGTMEINIVEGAAPSRLAYSSATFDLGAVKPPAEDRDIGFSGFRVLRVREGAEAEEVAIFQGATFFRAIARGQSYGVAARGLSLRTADPRGEEFPVFRAVWIEKPSLAEDVLIVHALLDSERLSGAYRFTLRAGETTIIDTETTLFTRAAIENIGIAAMAATYIAGPIDKRRNDDVRPAIHDVGGLQMLNGRGEWLWRPISSRETLQLSAFVDDQPRGFGFLQRDRNFAGFLDEDTHWERRPSLWVEPLNEWGPGEVTLIEIPSESEVNRNVIAYWRPRTGLAAKAELSFAYRQIWCWTPPERPPGATVTHSRSGRAVNAAGNLRKRRFMVEFTGGSLADAARIGDITANVIASPGSVTSSKIYANPERQTCRVVFEIDIGADTLCELRLLLEAHGKPVSEIWLFRWTP